MHYLTKIHNNCHGGRTVEVDKVSSTIVLETLIVKSLSSVNLTTIKNDGKATIKIYIFTVKSYLFTKVVIYRKLYQNRIFLALQR
jgi:hypothetical protein